MHAVLRIGLNDFRLFLRNRSSLVWLVVMPLAFVFFMGQANRGSGGPSIPRPAVVVDNRDEGFVGALLLDELGAQGLRRIHPTNAEAASTRRELRLATNFTAEVLAGRPARVGLVRRPGGNEGDAALVDLRLGRTLLSVNALLLEHAMRSTGAPLTAAGWEGLRAAEDPVRLAARFAGRRPIPTGYNLSLPGVLVMYLLMNLLTFGGAAVAGERRSGVMRRVMTLPVSRGALVGGKIFGLMLVATLQTGLLLLAGRFLFGVDLGDHLGGILVILLVYSWVAASLGVLIGSVLRAEDKVVGLCVLASMVMSALGGCWWPLEIVPESAQRVAHLIPTGWAMEALHRLITYGDGLSGAWPAVGVLVGFGLAANVAAARWFRV